MFLQTNLSHSLLSGKFTSWTTLRSPNIEIKIANKATIVLEKYD